jgi:hypothetical protein
MPILLGLKPSLPPVTHEILMGAFNRAAQLSTAILQFHSRCQFSIFDLTLDFRGDYFCNGEKLFAGIKDAIG